MAQGVKLEMEQLRQQLRDTSMRELEAMRLLHDALPYVHAGEKGSELADKIKAALDGYS